MNTKSALLCAVAGIALAPMAQAQEDGERGRNGQLNIIYWQAPSTLNPYLSAGTKEVESASIMLEPLARLDPDGEMVPWLAAEIPTLENGGISEDLTSVTWTLKPDVMWSDGTPLTADDFVFTWEYCTDPAGGCAQAQYFDNVTAVEAVDPSTVKITFDVPKPFPYTAFVGSESPVIQKAQFEACKGAAAPTCTDANFGPIGTGPYVVDEFRPNDVISMSANTNFREEGKPAFATVNFKGGGDAAGAARSVLETGEYDYAWNLQLAPEVLAQMEAAGIGTVVSAFGSSVERIEINHTDPSASLGDERSTIAHPHPFLTDPAVPRAMSKAIDREILVEIGYGPAGQATCNILPAPALYTSTANDDCLNYDIEEAKQILEDAGWTDGDGDGVREKDGVRLSVLYQTSVNAVRQDVQALVKEWWNEIGIEVELRSVDASVFFGADPASPDTFQKFYADVEMYTNNFTGVDPQAYMASWKCSDIPGPDSQWQGQNIPRFCSEEYDALVDKLGDTAEPAERGEIAKELNDMLIQNFAMIPLVHRGNPSAYANSLGGYAMSAWDSRLWDIKDWYRKAE